MRVVVLLALAGCGRIGFDALTAPPLDAPAGHDAAAPAIPDGAKLWLKMDNDPSTGIIDSAGGHTCFCDAATGCPTRVAGVHGSGYEFSSEAIQIVNANDLDLGSGFTAAAWVNIDGYPASDLDALFARPTSASNDSFVLAVSPDMNSTFDFEDPSGTTHAFEGPALPVGAWHHMAWVNDGVQTLGYVDGIEVGSAQATSGLAGSGFYFVGADDLPAAFFLAGTLDDVLLYTRPLTQAEIAQLATP